MHVDRHRDADPPPRVRGNRQRNIGCRVDETTVNGTDEVQIIGARRGHNFCPTTTPVAQINGHRTGQPIGREHLSQTISIRMSIHRISHGGQASHSPELKSASDTALLLRRLEDPILRPSALCLAIRPRRLSRW